MPLDLTLNKKHHSSGEDREPYGPHQGILIVCLSDGHRKEVSGGLQLPAYYIIPGDYAQEGKRFKRIIIFTPSVQDPQEMHMFQNWIENKVLPTRTIDGSIHYV